MTHEGVEWADERGIHRPTRAEPAPELAPGDGATGADDPQVAATSPPPVTPKRWTEEHLEQLGAYRKAHGTKKAAEHFGVSEARVRQLLPSDKPQPKGYFATQRRFHLDLLAAKKLIAWGWRDCAPVVPNADASRWFRADFQRSRIVDRYRSQRSAGHS